MKHNNWLSLLVLLLLLAGPSTGPRDARAEYVYPPLKPLPSATIRDLGPTLRGAELVLIETSPETGFLRQATTMALVAAAPEVVREVLIHPEFYKDFVRNMTKSSAERRPDGTIDHRYEISYSLVKTDGVVRYELLPPTPGDSAPAPVRIYDVTGTSHYRWEFHPPRSGGGTIVVVYGYTDMHHSGGLYQSLIDRAKTLEHGLAVMVQMTMMLAIKSRAQQQPGSFTAYSAPPAGAGPGYQPLLERGLVALLRSQGGRLSDISLIDRSRARPERLLAAAARPMEWSGYVPTISKSSDGGEGKVELHQSLPLLTFRTSYGVQAGQAAADMLGIGGDLRGARLRWDVRPEPGGQTQVVLRSLAQYDRASLVLRQLYRLEPLFEYGVNLGLSLPLLFGVKQRAEAL